MTKKVRLFLTMLFLTLLGGVNAAWGETAEFSPSIFSGQGTSGTGSPISATVKGVTFECDKGFGTTEIRCYSGSTITISSSNTITGVTFTFSNGRNGGLETSYTNLSTNSWEKELSSQARISAMTVTFESSSTMETVATPTFSPVTGVYTSSQDVAISCATNGVTIFYTTDGSNPTDNSSIYSSPIPVSSTTTIKAFARADGMYDSEIATAIYAFLTTTGTQSDPYSVADARAVIDANGNVNNVYATGVVSGIPTAYSSEYSNITFNFVDTEGDTKFLQAYRCVGDEAENVKVGDIVVVCGNLVKYGTTYEFAQGCELVSRVSPSTTPVINASNVTIAYNATSGAIGYSIENPIEGTALNATTSDADWITDITVGDESVTFTTTANEGDADRTATITLSYEGAEDVTVTVTQKHYVADFATLPFEFNGGKADIENTAGLTQSGLGDDYKSDPKLKFDGTGDNVILKIDERPGVLTFNIKGNNFSGGTFTVQTSEDGIEYTDVATYSTLGDTETKTISNLGEDVRYIKWIYTDKSSGNVALGNIALAQYVEPQAYTVSWMTGENITDIFVFAGDESEAIENGSSVDEGTTVMVSVDVADGYELEALTVKDAEENDISIREIEAGVYYSFEMPASNVTINATAKEYVAPTRDDYELFSGDLVEGDYIIYYDGKAMNTTVTSDRLQYEEVTPIDNVITTGNAAIVWHIAKNGDDWTIYNAEAEAYAASTGAKNKAQMLKLLYDIDERVLWTVTCNEDGKYEFVNKNNTTNGVNANLRNNGTYGFACYATSTGGALSLYKKVEKSVPVTISSAEYATLYYSDKAFEIPEGVTASIVTSTKNGKITFAELSRVIPAGTAVVLNGPQGTYDFKVVNDETVAPANNLLKGFDAPHLTEGGDIYYKLTVKNDKVGFYWGEENGEAFESEAHKAYLALSAEVAGAKSFYLFSDAVTDGIGAVESTRFNAQGAEIYNLNGQRVSTPQRGIYIINGKKVLVK